MMYRLYKELGSNSTMSSGEQRERFGEDNAYGALNADFQSSIGEDCGLRDCRGFRLEDRFTSQ